MRYEQKGSGVSSTLILSAEGLRKRYGDQAVVDNLSFRVQRGQCFSLSDPDGAGKTTTLRMLPGMTIPDAGGLRLCNEPVPEAAHRAHMRVGVVPRFDSLNPDFSVSENLRILGCYSDLSAATIRERIPTLLEFARLEQKADTPVRALSGGMKWRLTVARALINNLDILIMDEPTTGLGPQAWHLIWECLRSLLAAGKTILLTTHFMEGAERLCDELRVVDNGRKIAQGKPQELIAREIGCGVVEICSNDLNALRTLLTPLTDRVEINGETLFCYACNPQPLIAALRTQTETHTIPGLRYLHYPANLENVFLRLTDCEIRD